MMTKELTLEKREITCPHCKKHSYEVLACEWESSFSIHYIYFCVNCSKQVGIERKNREKSLQFSN